MNTAARIQALADTLATELGEKGWCALDAALPERTVAALAAECARADAGFTRAGIGRRVDYQRDESVRTDAIRWLDATKAADAEYMVTMDALRAALNSRLFLGLFDYECHYARYAPGACYRRHVDAFVGAKNRVLSTVLYLNRDWREEEGGELLLYEGDGTAPLQTLLPHYNRLVLFLSERFPHEVKPATRERHSIAGWFRVRA